VAFVEERRSKLALLLVKLDDAFFDGTRRNQPIDRDGTSLSDAAGAIGSLLLNKGSRCCRSIRRRASEKPTVVLAKARSVPSASQRST